jgi:hypothetical protein
MDKVKQQIKKVYSAFAGYVQRNTVLFLVVAIGLVVSGALWIVIGALQPGWGYYVVGALFILAGVKFGLVLGIKRGCFAKVISDKGAQVIGDKEKVVSKEEVNKEVATLVTQKKTEEIETEVVQEIKEESEVKNDEDSSN